MNGTAVVDAESHLVFYLKLKSCWPPVFARSSYLGIVPMLLLAAGSIACMSTPDVANVPANTPTASDVMERTLPSIVEILTDTGSGTGFIVSEDGLTVTNRHVVEGNRRVIVRLATGELYRGRVIGTHPYLDLANVAIDAERSFTPMSMGDSDQIRAGDDVIAIGFPLGDEFGGEATITRGIISAKREDFLQTDASLNPGNSGGPLLDASGHVVGVNTLRIDESGGRTITGISFAIAINEVTDHLGNDIPTAQLTNPPAPTSRPTPSPTAALPPAQAPRFAPIPLPTPVPTAIPTPMPTSTPIPTPTLTPTLTPTAIPFTDREALVALYHATGGPNWNNSINWLSNAPIRTPVNGWYVWHGIITDGGERVTKLTLIKNRLSGEIPPELGTLTNLRSLRLDSNRLSGKIPLELGSLANLKEMRLSDNQLSGKIPLELGSLTNLEILNLGRNQLSGAIPPELGNLANLKGLILYGNQLSGEIPPELGNLVNLEWLDLGGNQLNGCVPGSLRGQLRMGAGKSDLGGLPFC